MCGWLPLRRRLEDLVVGAGAGTDGDGEEDVFEAVDSGVDTGADPVVSAVAYLLEELGMEKGSMSMAFPWVPVFLGHSVEDNIVSVNLGREAVGCLKVLGVEVRWKEYEGLGHWYSEEMLHDIKEFLDEQLDESHPNKVTLEIKSDFRCHYSALCSIILQHIVLAYRISISY
jgi:hypothetical protein